MIFPKGFEANLNFSQTPSLPFWLCLVASLWGCACDDPVQKFQTLGFFCGPAGRTVPRRSIGSTHRYPQTCWWNRKTWGWYPRVVLMDLQVPPPLKVCRIPKKTRIPTGPSRRPVADKSAGLVILPRVLANAAAWFCALQSIYTDFYNYGDVRIAWSAVKGCQI